MAEILIYIHRNGQQQGPYTLPQLKMMTLTPDTPVWYEGLTDWMPASQAPLTAGLFNAGPVPPTPTPTPGMTSQPGNGIKPPSYLGWAIASCILCCLPLGIVAIIYAAQVNDKWIRGDYDGAYRASQNAQIWTIAAVVLGIIGSVVISVVQPAFWGLAMS